VTCQVLEDDKAWEERIVNVPVNVFACDDTAQHHIIRIEYPHLYSSRRQPERWVVITQIIRIWLLQSPLPIFPLPHTIFPFSKPKQPCTRCSRYSQHAQTHTMSRRIVERLTAQENIARHDSTQISKPNLHSRTNTPLIMPTQKIRQPHQHNRLRDV
jgi:hypothetical protein